MQQLIPQPPQVDRPHPPPVAEQVAPRAALRAISIEEPVSETFQECVLERGGYKVRLADTHGQRSKASMLIDRMYAWRGYHTEKVATVPHNPNRIMLEASSGQHLFGTLTLGLDSEEGLLADVLYQQDINVFRTAGRKVCELSKLAVDPQYGSKEVLASLFHLAYIYARIIHKAHDVFIEVNPRHAGFYEQRLGFRQIGEMRVCPRVNAPALLLHLELGYVDAQIAKHSGSRNNKERSLYPYFFSTLEAEGLAHRIKLAA
jgi:hypothetical protein